jgi:hypothetical protein
MIAKDFLLPDKTYTDFAGYKAGHAWRDNPAKSVHLCRQAEGEQTERVETRARVCSVHGRIRVVERTARAIDGLLPLDG